MTEIVPVIMPKWGLSMSEGVITSWSKLPGDQFAEGEELVEIETSKIANVYEAPFSGRLAKIVAGEGETIVVGGLIAVAADDMVSDEALDAFIANFQARFTPEDEAEAEGERPALSELAVGSKTIRVQVSGALTPHAVPAVLIHGFSGDINSWLFNLDALSGRGPVVALDLPGHGTSSKRLDSGSLGELAESVAGALRNLGIDRCDLVGHSLGAAVAMRVALGEPDLVRSLVLVAPAGLPGTRVNSEFLRGIANARSVRELKPVLGSLFSDPALATREMADDMMRFKRLDGADEALSEIAGRMIAGDEFRALQAELGALPTTTVILGRDDRIVGSPDRSAFPPEWRVIEIDAGHMPQLERASEFNTLLLETLP